ncbi:MAG: hypothetical protein GX621_19370 [Pirellulaceae bacterium]|mgnify:CR=1 FL=1|nr:hypothetical protein [Pirellulaceae bacterium]
MSSNTFLLADIRDLIWIGVVIVGGLISLFSQIAAKQREQKEAAERTARRLAAEGQKQAAGAPAGQPRPAALEDEIGEFLRRAAEGRAGQQRPPQARPAQARPVQARPVQARPVAGQAGSRRPAQARPGQQQPTRPQPARSAPIPVAIEVVEPTPRPVGGTVEARVSKDLDTAKFKQRAGQLGEHARQVAKQTEARLQRKFEHAAGTQAASKSPPGAPKKKADAPAFPATSAAGFAVMLRDVQTVRQAIILNEILTRPVDRW